MNNKINNQMKRFSRILFIQGILYFIISIIIICLFPSEGWYEPNIYTAYPLIFWIFIILALVCGLGSAIWEIFQAPDNYYWVYGLLVIVIVNTLLLTLPYVRHYAFTSSWDPIGHYSYILNIIEKGVPASNDFYPASHLQLAAFVYQGSIDLHDAILLFPVILYISFLCNVAFAVWVVKISPSLRGLILLLASPLMYQTFTTTFRPTFIAVFVMPILIALIYHSERKWEFRFLTIIIILYFPFLHPWAVIASLILFISYYFGEYILGIRDRINSQNVALILLIVWFIWFSTFNLFGKTFRTIIESFIYGLSGNFSIGTYLDRAAQASLQLPKILSLIIFTYGTTIIYNLLVIVIIIIVTYKIIKKRISELNIDTISLSIYCTIFFIISVISITRNIFTEGPLRTMNFILVIAPLLLADPIHRYISNIIKPHNKNKSILFVYMLLAFEFLLGTFNIYSSPLIGLPNLELSYAGEAGIRTMIEKIPKESQIIESLFSDYSIIKTSYNFDNYEALINKQPQWVIKELPYHININIVDSLNMPDYIIITAMERSYYFDVWPEGGLFTKDDIIGLLNNPEWNLIYSSRDIYLFQRRY